MVVPQGRGVSASKALWSEQMGEAEGDGSPSSLAVSILSLAGGRGSFLEEGAERSRGGGAGQLVQSLNMAVCSSSQWTQRGAEEEQPLGVAFRLPLLGLLELGHLWFERVWLSGQIGQTGSDDGH